MEEIIKLSKENAVLEERTRIMGEIDTANLPFGVWTLIKNIINPDSNPL